MTNKPTMILVKAMMQKKTQKQGATSTLTLFIITAIDPKHQLARIAPLRHN